MTMLVLETPEGVDLSREIAGPGSRSAAAILDVMVIAGVYASLFLLALLAESQGLSGVPIGMLQGGGLLILCLYPGISGILFDGRTFGKNIMGLRVVGDEGYPAEPLQHLMRSLIWPLELLLFVPIPLGLILIGVTPRRQRLGDMIAGTVVIRDERLSAEVEPFQGQTWSGLSRRSLDLTSSRIAVLDRRDYDLLRSLLLRRGLALEARRRLLIRTARHYNERLGLDGFQDARVFLKELYLFLRERQNR